MIYICLVVFEDRERVYENTEFTCTCVMCVRMVRVMLYKYKYNSYNVA